MNKTVFYAAILALIMPFSACGIGLGAMTVKSALDQPFLAEIELIDVGSTQLSNIKAGLANPEHFEQMGVASADLISLLQFKVEKNQQGRAVISVESVQRITEPYMELIIDVTCPQGQFYKAYTILLDPPGYRLNPFVVQGSHPRYKQVLNEPVSLKVHSMNKKQPSYGPTIANEDIWQIAQRYKPDSVNLPQTVLAIVGANPSAFVDGNLNGLKTGVTLIIPDQEDMILVPADLADEETKAQDRDWKAKSSIHHVLSPPYIKGKPVVSQVSAIPTIPKLYAQSLMPQNSILENNQPDEKLKAEISLTSAAIESVRASNALLMEQLHFLQEENKKLQKKLDKKDKELEIVHAQMDIMLKERINSGSQSPMLGGAISYLLLLLIAFIGGSGLAYWYFKVHQSSEVPKTDIPHQK